MSQYQLPSGLSRKTESTGRKVLEYGEMCLSYGGKYVREMGNPSYVPDQASFYKVPEQGMLIKTSNKGETQEVQNEDFLAIKSGGLVLGHVPVAEAFGDQAEIFGDAEFIEIYCNLAQNISRKISLLLDLLRQDGLGAELDRMHVNSGNLKVIQGVQTINQHYSAPEYLQAIIGTMQEEVNAWWNKKENKEEHMSFLAGLNQGLEILDDFRMYCAQYLFYGQKNRHSEQPRYQVERELLWNLLVKNTDNERHFCEMVKIVDNHICLNDGELSDNLDFVDAIRKAIHPASLFYKHYARFAQQKQWTDSLNTQVCEQCYLEALNTFPLKDALLSAYAFDTAPFGGLVLNICQLYLQEQGHKTSL